MKVDELSKLQHRVVCHLSVLADHLPWPHTARVACEDLLRNWLAVRVVTLHGLQRLHPDSPLHVRGALTAGLSFEDHHSHHEMPPARFGGLPQVVPLVRGIARNRRPPSSGLLYPLRVHICRLPTALSLVQKPWLHLDAPCV